jgi:hypothetical protein
MNLQPKIHLFLFIVFLLSCNNKKQEQIYIEGAQRMERQNGMAQVLNRRSEERILDDYSSARFKYFQGPMKYYVEKARNFDNILAEATRSNNTSDFFALFNHYQTLQQGYRLLNQVMNDSFTYWKIDTAINAFMSMDEKTFASRYMSGKDSLNNRLRLAFLQSDAIWMERLFLEKIEFTFNPSGSTFGVGILAIGNSDKIIYKKGEKMKLTVGLVNFAHKEIEYAIIGGKKVQPDNEYSFPKKVTENRGLHVFRFVVCFTSNGKLES